MGAASAHERETEARIDRWLAAVDRVAPGDFTPVAASDDLPEQARAESFYWCDEVLSPSANPHDAPGTRHAYHRAGRGAPDLVRHDYTALGLALTVTEARAFLIVRVDPRSLDVLALPPPARAAALHDVARGLFRAHRGRAPTFPEPGVIEEGARFSTDEGADPMLLAAWGDRIEAGVRGGALYFLCYKKAAQRVGFAGGERWLGESPVAGRRPGRGVWGVSPHRDRKGQRGRRSA